MVLLDSDQDPGERGMLAYSLQEERLSGWHTAVPGPWGVPLHIVSATEVSFTGMVDFFLITLLL